MNPHVEEWRQGTEIMVWGKANSNRTLGLAQMKKKGTQMRQKPEVAFLVTLSSLYFPNTLKLLNLQSWCARFVLEPGAFRDSKTSPFSPTPLSNQWS